MFPSWRSRLRIIPAYAGSTACVTSARRRSPDHPRIRGEHERAGSLQPRSAGSSPHTRGARLGRHLRASRQGIIPAYAGSTWAYGRPWLSPADHPRIRGEHARGPFHAFWRRGSSPHTRGAQPFYLAFRVMMGIIPAYAGSTKKALSASSGRRDHPRIRGEHDDSDQYSIDGLGSSPHTRGAPRSTANACTTARDHPRIRGEHFTKRGRRLDRRGSSPHTRGARSRILGFFLRERIIPAYAGSTINWATYYLPN